MFLARSCYFSEFGPRPCLESWDPLIKSLENWSHVWQVCHLPLLLNWGGLKKYGKSRVPLFSFLMLVLMTSDLNSRKMGEKFNLFLVLNLTVSVWITQFVIGSRIRNSLFRKNWWGRLLGMPGVSLFNEMVSADIKSSKSFTLGVFCTEAWQRLQVPKRLKCCYRLPNVWSPASSTPLFALGVWPAQHWKSGFLWSAVHFCLGYPWCSCRSGSLLR